MMAENVHVMEYCSLAFTPNITVCSLVFFIRCESVVSVSVVYTLFLVYVLFFSLLRFALARSPGLKFSSSSHSLGRT